MSTITTATLAGVGAVPVKVSATREALLPNFLVVGFGAATYPAVKELRERVRSAIEAQGFGPFPRQRVVVEMTPADLPKRGTGFDLPVALAVLGVGDPRIGAVGELSLGGDVYPVRGLIPILTAMKKAGIRKVLVPSSQAREAGMVPGLSLWPVRHLADAVQAVRTPGRVHSSFLPKPEDCPAPGPGYALPASAAVLSRQIAAALRRGKSVLIRGGPGSGATLAVRHAVASLPNLSAQGSREVTSIYSASGLLAQQSGCRIVRPPLRAPHHTVSVGALVGGRQGPGEVTLAHRGVLLLDEVDEFARATLEALGAARKRGQVSVPALMGGGGFDLPAKFKLVGILSPGGDERRAGFAGRWDVVLDAPATAGQRAHRGLTLGEVRPGDRVVWLDQFGKQHAGRVSLLGPAGLVVNAGGRYGTPQVVTEANFVRATRLGRGWG